MIITGNKQANCSVWFKSVYIRTVVKNIFTEISSVNVAFFFC